MQPTKENLECADLILMRNHLRPEYWKHLRNDIAQAITLAEEEIIKKIEKNKIKK